MKLNAIVRLSILAAVVSLFAACKPADEEPTTTYGDGVFISCEGPFGSGSGTVNYYNRTTNAVSADDVFNKENSGSIGNVLQSMAAYNGKIYLLANNADKMHVVDPKTFKLQTTVTGFKYPNHFLGVSSTIAYISEWGDNGLSGRVRLFSLDSSKFVRLDSTGRTTIATGKGAFQMVKTGNRVWVANNGGTNADFTKAQDSTVAIIDIKGDSLLQKLTVGFGPNSIVEDANGDVWVLCGGYNSPTVTNKPARLVKIKNNVIERVFSVPDYASKMITDASKQNLYFVAGNKVYKKDILNFGATAPSVLTTAATFTAPYGLGIDPKTGYIFVADAKNFTTNGTVTILDAKDGSVKNTLTVGVAPNGFIFQ